MAPDVLRRSVRGRILLGDAKFPNAPRWTETAMFAMTIRS